MEQLMGAMAQVVKAIVKWIKRVVIVINSIGLPLFIVLLVGTVITISIAEQSNSSSSDNETSISEEDAGEGTAQDTIKFAKQYVGKNLQYFLDHDNSGRFFGNHWCAMFCGYVLYNTNKDSIASKTFSASCSAWASALNSKGKLHLRGSSYNPKAGDLVFFGPNGTNHVGMITSSDKSKKTFTTIEGNSGQGPYPWGSVVTDGSIYSWTDSTTNGGIYGFGEVDYQAKSEKVDSKYINEKTKNFTCHNLEYTGTKTKLTADEKDVLLRSLYKEAGGTGFECKVYVCSATLNLWQQSYSDWSLSRLLHKKDQFETADRIDSVTESQKKSVEEAADFVLNGGRVKDIKYFRTNHYHNDWVVNPTPVCHVDNVYFSK